MFTGLRYASRATGLTVYALRRGIAAGEYPAIRIGYGERKRIKVNPEQILMILDQKALLNVRTNNDGVGPMANYEE